MRFSHLFTKTLREVPADEIAVNAQLLIRGGFIFKNSAGIYSFLPLGLRVLEKIKKIVREEINNIGGQEILMPTLVEKKYMEPTGRWNLDVGFFVKGKEDKEANFVLGWSHEEVLTAIAAKYTNSYKDLPFAAYQIQTKFRNEPRAKSGLLRGREFLMKDLYSFHTSADDLEAYYGKVKDSYFNIFKRSGLKSFYTLAGGGIFTEDFTHEFQVISEVGEDIIFVCRKCEYSENKEISKLKAGDPCPKCSENISEERAIEVGNIFKYGPKYSEKLGLYSTDEDGSKKPVLSGAYGVGISRLMATVVELHSDSKGIIWPESLAPFKVHLIDLDRKTDSDLVYEKLQSDDVEIIYDDRDDQTAGEKFADADLIGCPIRLVIGPKTPKNQIEFKRREESQERTVEMSNLLKELK